MLNRTKRALQKRCTGLALDAQRLLRQSRGAEGLARYTDAMDIARRLAEAEPDDPRPLGQYAAMLRSAGSLFTQVGDDASALRSLSACESIYRDLGDRWKLDVRHPLAEVKARKTVTETGLGLGASAVLDADEAVTLYRGLRAEKASDELALALAGALVDNAEALTLYGDPDLVAASAGHAMRLCLTSRRSPGFSAARLQVAAAIASAYHAAAGRLDLALEADQARITAGRMEAQATGSAADRRSLATALASRGLHLQATGDPASRPEAAACLAEAGALDAAAVREAAQFWERQQAQGNGVTLARALVTAAERLGRDRVPADLAADLTRPAADGVLMIPSDRCLPRLATGYAARLAAVAVALLPVAPWEGLRAGLEAHYLFAIGAPLQAPEQGQFAAWGVPWARLLFELCRALAALADPPWSYALALNLVPSHLWVIDRLLPLARGIPRDTPPGDGGRSLGGLLRDCLAQDADLLTRNQDYAQAQQLRQLAATITG